MRDPSDPKLVGVISDTHGLLREQAVDALRGADLILHAGDVGTPEVLAHLRELAPVFAVRGNVDRDRWAMRLPASRTVTVGRFLFYVLHEISQLDLDPAAAGIAAVVVGHSHQASIASRDGVLYLNPGSAGPRRFHLAASIALVHISAKGLRAEIVELDAG